MSYLGQNLFIETLNEELKKQNFSSKFRLNKGGVCNGLAIVYAKYVLEKKEDEFFKILELIASGKIDSESERNHGLQVGTVYYFASQVLLAFAPMNFDSRFSQTTGMEMLNIEGNSLKSSFDFAIATTDKNWASLLREINLMDDEVMFVQSLNHAISIRKVNNQYRVYDPNYSNGFKEFSTEEALMNELHNNVFEYKKGNLGMKVHIIRDPRPNPSPRKVDFPDIIALYQNSFKETSIHAEATSGSKQFKTLLAITETVRDPKAIEEILNLTKPNQNQIFEATKKAVISNNAGILEPLLNRIAKDQSSIGKLDELIKLALASGRKESFDVLEKSFDACFKNKETIETALSLLSNAANGGNPHLIQKTMDLIKPYLKNYFDIQINELKGLDKIDSEADKAKLSTQMVNRVMVSCIHKSIRTAISKGHSESISLLINELNHYKQPLNDKQRLDYLLDAIKNNEVYALQTLIKTDPESSKKLLQHITMTPLAVKNTELDVLKELQRNGMVFSSEAEEIMKNKLPSLHTTLMLIFNYIGNLFGKKQVAYDENKLIEIKKAECLKLLEELESNNTVDKKYTETIRNQLDNEQDFSKIDNLREQLQLKLNEVKIDNLPVMNLYEIFDGDDFDDLLSEDNSHNHGIDSDEESQINKLAKQQSQEQDVTNEFKEKINQLKKPTVAPESNIDEVVLSKKM